MTGLTDKPSTPRTDRVPERAVARERHFHRAEGQSIAQIAAGLGRSPAMVKAYFYDPTGEKARAVKARYVCTPGRMRIFTSSLTGQSTYRQRIWREVRVALIACDTF